MTRKNCWEFHSCGREQGGARVAELGECPAARSTSSDGLNRGKNGGRICWSVAGTFCDGEVQGTFAKKLPSCMNCEFYQLVKKEEGPFSFKIMKPGQKYEESPKEVQAIEQKEL